jgi:hypothetical protein
VRDTLKDNRYPAIMKLDIDDCKPYANEVIDNALNT